MVTNMVAVITGGRDCPSHIGLNLLTHRTYLLQPFSNPRRPTQPGPLTRPSTLLPALSLAHTTPQPISKHVQEVHIQACAMLSFVQGSLQWTCARNQCRVP